MIGTAWKGGEMASSKKSYFNIFFVFFRIGLFTLGGGLAMAAVMRHELVLKRQWLADEEFMEEMSAATLIPGAIAVNMAFLQGRRMHGKCGALAAVFGTILPSFLIILLIALFAMPYFSQPKIKHFLRGCAIAVAGQLAFTCYIFARRYLRNWHNVIVCAAGFFVAAILKLHPVWAVLVAGGIGYFFCQINASLSKNKNDII